MSGCKKARDNGYNGECLECPFPKCYEDITERLCKQEKIQLRDREIIDKRLSGASKISLSREYNLSRWKINKLTGVRMNVISASVKVLTPRMIEILKLMADGYVEEQICSKLKIKRRTVKGHKTAMYKRLSAKNSTHAIAIAKDQGII